MNIQLKRIRKQRNVTQKQLANDIGATIRQIGYWEKGNLSLEDACTLADYFGITLDELAGREWQDPTLTTDESKLLGDYRSLTKRQRDSFRATISSVADGGEAKNSGVSQEAV